MGINYAALQKRKELYDKLTAAREAAAAGRGAPARSALDSDGAKNVASVVRGMAEAERKQQALIEQRTKIMEKERLRKNVTSGDKNKHVAAENEFFRAHTAFESEFNRAHSAEYFRTQKLANMISRTDGSYETPDYDRDVLDGKIAALAEQQGIGKGEECFARTISDCRYVKGDFGTRYVDSRMYLSGGGGEPVPMRNIEMLSVALKKAVTKNPNIITPYREPKSKEEQAIIDLKVKAAIASNNVEMVPFIDEMKIEKELAKQELNLENNRLKLCELAEKAFRLQQSIVETRENRQLLLDCGGDLPDKELKAMHKDEDKLENIFGSIDKKLDSILTFNKMDKEDYWAQIEMGGKERYKDSFGAATPVPLPDENLLTTIQRAKGDRAVKAFSADDYFRPAERDATPTRRKTDIVKRALDAERAKNRRELSPDPAGKKKSLELTQQPILKNNASGE